MGNSQSYNTALVIFLAFLPSPSPQGETFSGLGEHLEDAALPAVEELRALVPEGATMAQFALRWILMHRSAAQPLIVIPGCRTTAHVKGNLAAAELAPLDVVVMESVKEIYDRLLKDIVHSQW